MTDRKKEGVRREYEALPWYRQALQAADDVARMGANGITLGGADKLAAYMNGTPEEAERAKTDDAVSRAGAAALAAKIVGTMAPSRVATLPGLSVTSVVPPMKSGIMGMVSRSAALGGDALGLHTLQSYGEARPEPEKDAQALILQALLSRR